MLKKDFGMDIEHVAVFKVLDEVSKYVRKEDFILEKEYRVKTEFEDSAGKWSNVFKDAIFIDSKKFVPVYSKKISHNL